MLLGGRGRDAMGQGADQRAMIGRDKPRGHHHCGDDNACKLQDPMDFHRILSLTGRGYVQTRSLAVTVWPL
jgi:hypothetical protein